MRDLLLAYHHRANGLFSYQPSNRVKRYIVMKRANLGKNRRCEAGFQPANRQPLGMRRDEPRALPWADIRQAFGLRWCETGLSLTWYETGLWPGSNGGTGWKRSVACGPGNFVFQRDWRCGRLRACWLSI